MPCFTCGKKFTGESVMENDKVTATFEVKAAIHKYDLYTLSSFFGKGNEALASFPGKSFVPHSIRFLRFETDDYSSDTQIFVGRLLFSDKLPPGMTFTDFNWLEEKAHG